MSFDQGSFSLSYPKERGQKHPEGTPEEENARALAAMCHAYRVPLVATWEALDEATKHLWLAPKFLNDEVHP